MANSSCWFYILNCSCIRPLLSSSFHHLSPGPLPWFFNWPLYLQSGLAPPHSAHWCHSDHLKGKSDHVTPDLNPSVTPHYIQIKSNFNMAEEAFTLISAAACMCPLASNFKCFPVVFSYSRYCSCIFTCTHALHWMFVSPSNSYVEALIPHVLVFGGGTLGRELELDEVIRVEPSWWD